MEPFHVLNLKLISVIAVLSLAASYRLKTLHLEINGNKETCPTITGSSLTNRTCDSTAQGGIETIVSKTCSWE